MRISRFFFASRAKQLQTWRPPDPSRCVKKQSLLPLLWHWLEPRRSLLVINRVDVETRPFAMTRSCSGRKVDFKLVPPNAGPKIAVERRLRF